MAGASDDVTLEVTFDPLLHSKVRTNLIGTSNGQLAVLVPDNTLDLLSGKELFLLPKGERHALLRERPGMSRAAYTSLKRVITREFRAAEQKRLNEQQKARRLDAAQKKEQRQKAAEAAAAAALEGAKSGILGVAGEQHQKAAEAGAAAALEEQRLKAAQAASAAFLEGVKSASVAMEGARDQLQEVCSDAQFTIGSFKECNVEDLQWIPPFSR